LDLTRPLRPVAAPSLRPWAGRRLGSGVGELWIAGPASLVPLADGPTVTLEALAAEAGAALVGAAGMATLGPRFPLLAKLIDAGDWLSLQVHPDDELARRLYGAEAVGKDEAWVVLAVDPGTRLVMGPGRMSRASLMAAISAGALALDDLVVHAAAPGDAIGVRAGTIHAIGPGAFVYEIEQPSDLTFRISDWGRPVVPGRHLHPEESRLAVDASLQAEVVGRGWQLSGGAHRDRHLQLEIAAGATSVERRPTGRSPELVTAYGGAVTLRGTVWTERLASLETAVVPAAVDRYDLDVDGGGVALIGSLPG
jgi:mannose-6-phosphate isomerase